MIKKYIKIFLISAILLTLSACGGGDSGSGGDSTGGGGGTIIHTILNPYGSSIAKDEESLNGGSTTNFLRTVETRYSDFDHAPEIISAVPGEPYCRIGGPYKINVVVDSNNGGKYNQTEELYYCKTTKDLVQKIRIPNSWREDNLNLYCNDGGNINIQQLNSDFLTSAINNMYKVCVLKNDDYTEHNTIIYAFEVGNSTVDSNSAYFFETTNTTPLVSDFTYENFDGEKYTFKDENENTFYFFYNTNEKFIILTDFLNSDFNYAPFTLPHDFDISRIALFKQISNSGNIYGYEKAIKFETNNVDSSVKPVYNIKFDESLAFNQELCTQSLGMYSPQIIVGNLGSTDMVGCQGDNVIKINSKNVDTVFGESKALELFENIIINTNN